MPTPQEEVAKIASDAKEYKEGLQNDYNSLVSQLVSSYQEKKKNFEVSVFNSSSANSLPSTPEQRAPGNKNLPLIALGIGVIAFLIWKGEIKL